MASETTATTRRGGGKKVWLALLALPFAMAVGQLALSGAGAVIFGAAIAIFCAFFVVRYPVVGILLYLVTFLFSYPNFLKGTGNFTINNMMGLLFVPLVFYGLLREGKLWIVRLRPLILMALIGVVFIASGFLYQRSIDLQEGVRVERVRVVRKGGRAGLIEMRDARAKFLTRYAFLVFFIFFVRSPRDIKLVVGTIVACLLLTYLNVSMAEGPMGASGRLRVLGAAGTGLYTGRNPNKLAYFSLLCLTLLWYGRRAIKKPILYPFWLATTVIAFVIIPLTASRSGLLNLLLFMAIVLFEGRFSYRKIVGFVLAAMLITLQFGFGVSVLDLMLPQPVSARLSNFRLHREALAEGQVATGSVGKRWTNVNIAWRMAVRHPLFGIGLGNFSIERPLVDPAGNTAPPHNSYLYTFAEGGFVTLTLYLMIFGGLFRSLRRLEKDYEARFGPMGLGWLVSAMRTAIVGFLFFSLFADMWVNVLFHILVGMCTVLIEMHKVYAETGRLPRGAMAPAITPA